MHSPNPDISLQILNHAPMGIIIVDSDGVIIWSNSLLASWLDKQPTDAVGRTEAELFRAEMPANGPHKLASGRWLMRKVLPQCDGQQAICFVDVSEEEGLRRERNQIAQQLAQHNTVDPLSGLLNERAINNGLEPLVSRSRRYENPLSTVTMELTNLDSLIDSNGQVAVDRSIVTVSQLLRDQLRWADLVGRLDSGQFVFILPETDQEAAIALANKIAGQLNDLRINFDDGSDYQPLACFGVSSWQKGDDSRLLMSRSAEAVQAAINAGAFSVKAA